MSEKPLCNICHTPMTTGESLHQDCGGDCLLCMAEVGDDACIATVLRLARKESKTPCGDLLREARDELLWWINEHGCCAGHEGDLIDRIDAVIPEPKDGNA